MNKESAKNILGNVPEDKVFWVNDGRTLRNLQELSLALANMNEETFRYHVNKEKNDFRNWVKDVIKDEKLANDIAKIKSKKLMLERINKKINQLQSLISKINK